jgi:uncharacterized protein YeaO (DUF488 family)
MTSINVKRIYEEPSKEDGYRILVDRLWPRGFTKERAGIDEWAKQVSPSSDIRKEFHQNPVRMDSFRIKYILELENNKQTADFVNHINHKLKEGNVTLLYAAKDRAVNHAVILKEWLESRKN